MCLNVSAAISCAIKDPCEAFDGCLKLYHGCGGKLVQCSLDASCKQDPRSVHAGMLNHRKARRRVRCSPQAFCINIKGCWVPECFLDVRFPASARALCRVTSHVPLPH